MTSTGDEGGDVGFADRMAVPCVDSHVDHAFPLAPPFVDVSVEEPLAIVDRAVLDVSVVVMAVASVGKVRSEHGVIAHGHDDVTLVDLGEAGVEVALRPTIGPGAVPEPAAVVVSGEEQLAAVQFAHQ